jgi:cysteinyl-tRNA synthetase
VLRLYDSVARDVRELEMRDPGRFTMYVCGPTVSGSPHLGHGRFSLVWDVVRRWISFHGIEVNYVSNITDIDDRIIARARDEGRSERDVAAEFETEWVNAMAALGVATPSSDPHATSYVEEMVSLIVRLISCDAAYETSDGVYFDVSKVSDYGVLAGQDVDALRAGARVETIDEKRSPLDFALWKKAKADEPSWDAPFGAGRPGWHTECVVMSDALLGDGFDLHAGGLDLKFPHHENERAQAVALGQRFSRRWAHNGWVMVGNEKMGKSLNNFTTLSELLASSDQRAYRLLVLRSHYRSPIEISKVTLGDAERALERLDSFARRFELAPRAGQIIERMCTDDFYGAGAQLLESVSVCLDNDLDTPGALSLLFDALSSANSAADNGDEKRAGELASAIGALLGALGLSLNAVSEQPLTPETQSLIRARDVARAQRNWAEADRLREELVHEGWTVEDSANGTVVRR